MKMRFSRDAGFFRIDGRTLLALQTLLLLFPASYNSLVADDSLVFLGDANPQLRIEHQQQWGDFGWNTAAAATGRPGSPMRIGDQTYERGLGHHASGEIVVPLNGQYVEFRSQVGVQWQGGGKGSVIFRVLVDGRMVFESDSMSDSDPAREVQVSVAGARELRLVAYHAGDGIACDMANWANSRLVADSSAPMFGPATVEFNDSPAPAATADASGFSIIAAPTTPQVCVMQPAGVLAVNILQGEDVRLTVPVTRSGALSRTMVEASIAYGQSAEVGMSVGGPVQWVALKRDQCIELSATVDGADAKEIVLLTRGIAGDTAVRWRRLRFACQDDTGEIPIILGSSVESLPPPALPELRSSTEKELIEWDWRLQDGIGTPRESTTWQDAIQTTLTRADLLLQHLEQESARPLLLEQRWMELRNAYKLLSESATASEQQWESLWRRIHWLRRETVLSNPLADLGPIAFAKRVPSSFSHQLTQYYGRAARPGGGLFVLETPGRSMKCRQLGDLPIGSYLHPEVSWDGRKILFAFCDVNEAAPDYHTGPQRFYHLYEINADGRGLKQLTHGDFDDFSPRYLPNGEILFVSTRRGGFHRCGRGPCPVYTLSVVNPDGGEPRVISFHETHEWDPVVLHDGRVVYTRWDYVDRHAVHYQQLWSVRPDGSNVSIFYGNNTLNPVGVWEARPVPGSNQVMATAAAHHAMTAGSIILLDVARGVDGLDPVTRMTPDALFPESEFPVQQWHAPAGVTRQPEVPVQEQRWPGHCYRTPFPLSQDFFLAAYSFEPLIGEPSANLPNMFGLYLVDRWGNKELLYRDTSIGSLWPVPLRPRSRPPALASTLDPRCGDTGTFFLQDVYKSWPAVIRKDAEVKQLRIIQVLPKTTPHSNTPRVGFANASPGKQVLGTVPVESDGSAYFEAPARTPIAFQALDEHGMAIQTMRSLTYLQPGEHISCVGCHEHRSSTPDSDEPVLAQLRAASKITPGPDGSRPFSYPILVQPVLDKHCVRCHQGAEAEGGIVLTGDPAGEFTASYQTLAKLVPYSEWKGTPQANYEPLTKPNLFGARASQLAKLLFDGHEGVTLSDAEMERLITWMDTNALFYGTFSPEDQQRQRRGERIQGPALQ